jgi:hypothetical protein
MTGTIVISLVIHIPLTLPETIRIGQPIRDKKGVQNTVLICSSTCRGEEGYYYYFKVLSK